jgi:hypothetical protein
MFGSSLVLRTDYIEDFGTPVECKLHFLFIHSLLGLINAILFSFSSLHSLLKLCFVWSDLNWSTFLLLGTLLRLTTQINLRSAHRGNLQSLWHIGYFQGVEYYNDALLGKLNLLTLHTKQRPHVDALFLIHFFIGNKCCPSNFETVGNRVPTWNVRMFTVFSCSCSHCP